MPATSHHVGEKVLGQLPPRPDFEAMAAAAPASADRRTLILSLIGNLIVSWSNNESLFIYVLMILLDTDQPSAAIGRARGQLERCLRCGSRSSDISVVEMAERLAGAHRGPMVHPGGESQRQRRRALRPVLSFTAAAPAPGGRPPQ